MKCIYSFIGLTIGLGLHLISLPSRAQTVSHQPQLSPRLLLTQRPSNLGHPQDGTRRGGGSRGGGCELPSDLSPLTALMPDTATWTASAMDQEWVLSLTRRPSPDLWFYVPYGLTSSSRVEFTLKDTDENTLTRARLDTNNNLPQTPGIIQVSLADLKVTLAPDTGYHWYLTVRCTRGPLVSVDGWIHYQSPLENAREPDVVTSQQFLVDQLTELANQRMDHGSSHPEWQRLLESVGLSDISEAPLLDCCTFVK